MQVTLLLDDESISSTSISSCLSGRECFRSLSGAESCMASELSKDCPKLPPPTRYQRRRTEQGAGSNDHRANMQYRREWNRQVGRQIMASSDTKLMRQAINSGSF
eukprot:767482-Hanusia_phi.AAC.2